MKEKDKEMNRQPVKMLSEERKAFERLIFRAVVALLVSGAVILFWPLCWNYLSPFIISVPIAAMLQPIIRFGMKKLKLKRSPASVIPVLFLLFAFIGLMYWFISFGFSRLNAFIAGAPMLIADTVSSIRTGFEQLIASIDGMSPETVTWLRNAMNEGLSWLTVQATAMGGQLVSIVTSMATGIPNAFIYLNFFMVGLYFITKNYPSIRAKLPGGRAHDPNSNASQLTKAGLAGALGYLRVQATYGVLSLVAGTIVLSFFKFPYAWAIALCAAILEFLPLFGNGTLYIPWSIIAYVLGDARTGTIVILLYLVLITIRRITEPKIMSANIGVSPLTSLIGMFVGMKMGGIIGLIGGPIVMTILGAVVHGHYLNGIRRDIRTLIAFGRHRWDYGDKKPYTPPKPDPGEEE